MADIVSKEQRSANMAAIRGKDTGPEVYLRKQLFSRGYRYRKNSNTVAGHPDLYLAKYHTAVFVNGCYWHRHQGCKYAYTPKSRVEFWTKKFESNIARDQVVRQKLMNEHVKQLVVWECTIKKMKRDEAVRDHVLNQIENFFIDTNPYMEI